MQKRLEERLNNYYLRAFMEFINNYYAPKTPQSNMQKEAKKFRKALEHPRNSTNSQLAFLQKGLEKTKDRGYL